MSSSEAHQPISDSVIYAVDAQLEYKCDVLSAIANSIVQMQFSDARRFKVGVYIFNTGDDGYQEVMELGTPKVSGLKILSQLSKGCNFPHFKNGLVHMTKAALERFDQVDDRCLNRMVIFSSEYVEIDCKSLPILQMNFLNLIQNGVLIVPALFKSSEGRNQFWTDLSKQQSRVSKTIRNIGIPVSTEPIAIESSAEKKDITKALEQFVQQKAQRKKIEFRGVLKMSNLEIGICGYKLVSMKTMKQQRFYKVNKKYECVHTPQRTLDSTPKGFNIQPNSKAPKIPVSNDDLKILRECDFGFEESTLEIIRFISVKQCDIYRGMQLYPSNFILPSDVDTISSKSTFASLHRNMVQKNRVGLAIFYSSISGRSPVLGFLYACTGTFPVKNEPKNGKIPSSNIKNYNFTGPSHSQGMYFVKLPFIDDLRGFSKIKTYDTTHDEQLFNEMSKLLDLFYYKPGFSATEFSNPIFEHKSKVLENWVLNGLYSEPKDFTHNFNKALKPEYKLFTECSNILMTIERINKIISMKPEKQ